MFEKLFDWKGYGWMNGQPWGVAHSDKNQLWYSNEDCVKKDHNDNLILSVVDDAKYFDGDINHTKPYGCGYISTLERFRFGHFEFKYILPIGVHLWPAIWLSGWDNWPPEIDIVEGWSGEGYFCKNKPNYKKFIGLNRIHPGVFYGRDGDNVFGKGYGNFGTNNLTYQWYQNLKKENRCDLFWYPDSVKVYYNFHKVMDINDKNILNGLDSDMYVCLDCAVSNCFTEDDYKEYNTNGSPFIITDFNYEK